MASHLSIVLNLRIILIIIRIKCLPKKRLHDLKKKKKTGYWRLRRGLSRSPLFPSSLGWALTSLCGLAGLLFWTRTGRLGQVFFPCCLFWCVCFMFKSCGLVWRQPEKNQTVQVVSEGPIHVSAERVVLTDAPVGCCRGLKKKEHLHRPACYICWVARLPASVKCANRGRQTFCSQHVSSPRKSITFHKEMLTIKRVH